MDFTFTFNPKENPGLKARLDEFAEQLNWSREQMVEASGLPAHLVTNGREEAIIHTTNPDRVGTMTCSVAGDPSEAE